MAGGGIAEISAISGVHRNTILAGIKELKALDGTIPERSSLVRVRAAGGGRKPVTETQPGIMEALEKPVSPETYDNPENPPFWTTKSLRKLADGLSAEGFSVKKDKVVGFLKTLGYSLLQNQKMKQAGREFPDRDAQFRHINSTAAAYMEAGQPVISIDCKKKENVGNFKNNGVKYCPKGSPKKVPDHDFPLSEFGKAVPYGIYDPAQNKGYVNVGINSDIAVSAVNSIKSWCTAWGCCVTLMRKPRI